MRRLNWKRKRGGLGRQCRDVTSATAECGIYFVVVYRRRDGDWQWMASAIDNLALDGTGGRDGAVFFVREDIVFSLRDAMRAARKALARMGLR